MQVLQTITPFHGRTTINLVDAHIVLSNVDKILNFAEEDLFQMNVHGQTVDLQYLYNLIERADSRSYTQGIDATKMLTTLRNEEMNHHTTSWVWPKLIIVVSVGCGATWPIWVTFIKGCCPCINKCITCILRPTITSSVHRLNENEIGLQILPQEDGVVEEETTSTTSPGYNPEALTTLTGYVGHGRLIADPL
jgi:hypothetical protein